MFFLTQKLKPLPSPTSEFSRWFESLSPPKQRCYLRFCLRFLGYENYDECLEELSKSLFKIVQIDLSLMMLKKQKGHEYFSFDGGNVFSWKTKDVSEEQKKALYQMVVDNIIKGVLRPLQKLPDYYHNQILAEAIKGNRKLTVIEYLELK